jgi:hypothetical protein
LQHHARKTKKRSSKSLQKLFHNLKHRSSKADATGEAEEEDDDDDGMVDNADNATEENIFMTKSCVLFTLASAMQKATRFVKWWQLQNNSSSRRKKRQRVTANPM